MVQVSNMLLIQYNMYTIKINNLDTFKIFNFHIPVYIYIYM